MTKATIVTVVVSGVLVGICFVLPTPSTHTGKVNSSPTATVALTPDLQKKIKNGMSRADVQRILGGPPGDYSVGVDIIDVGASLAWSGYHAKDMWWVGDDCAIAVCFDSNGLVEESRWREVIHKNSICNSDSQVMVLVYDPSNSSEEWDKLRGAWTADKVCYYDMEFDSKSVQKSLGPRRIVFTPEAPIDIEKCCDVYCVQVDTKTSPKRLVGAVAGGKIKGCPVLGVYELNGERLRVAFSEVGVKTYPAKVGASKHVYYYELSRVPPKKP